MNRFYPGKHELKEEDQDFTGGWIVRVGHFGWDAGDARRHYIEVAISIDNELQWWVEELEGEWGSVWTYCKSDIEAAVERYVNLGARILDDWEDGIHFDCLTGKMWGTDYEHLPEGCHSGWHY